MRHFLLLLFLGLSQFSSAQTADFLFAQADELFNQAETSLEQKEYQSALKSIDQALEIDSTKAIFYDLKAFSLFKLEQYQEAFDIYSKAIVMFPNDPSLYNGRGNFLLTITEFEAAIQDFTSGIKVAKSDSTINYLIINRAAAKLNIRDFNGAYDDLIWAYNYDPNNIGMLTNLGAVCDEIGRGDETLKYLLKAVEVDSMFAPAYGNIGFKYQEMGQHEKAIEYFDKVLAFDPNDPLGFSNRSYNKLKLGDLKGAMSDIERSIEIYPDNPYAYRNRALIYIEKGKFKLACEDLQAALDRGYTLSYGDDVLELQAEHCKE